MPKRYGKWQTVSCRFYRWRESGVWQRLLKQLQAEADADGEFDWTLHYVDGSVIRAYQHAAGARGTALREPEHFPSSWPAALNDEACLEEAAMALASWIGFTPETHQERARQVAAALLATPPPPGWRPFGPDDELLRTHLPDEKA